MTTYGLGSATLFWLKFFFLPVHFFCDSFLSPMAAMQLFRPCNTALRHYVVFDYVHDGRAKVEVWVNITDMTLDYCNCSEEWTGKHGHCAERNPFDGNFVGKPVHQIQFTGLRAPHGRAQCLLFSQIGAYAWKAEHRTGAVVTISLQRPGSRQWEIDRPIQRPADVIVLSLGDYDREDGGDAAYSVV